MKKKYVFRILIAFGICLFLVLLMQVVELLLGGNIAMLYPKGIIALKQRNLLLIIQALMLIVVIPVFILFFVFSWKYKAGHSKEKYTPDWDDNRTAEFIWWGVPFVLVIIIGALSWVKTHELDPYKPLETGKKPVTIQVVALQWKWLFIYPELGIASVNFLQFPEKTPISFEITADAPMNSFWIPQLSGQIFAMPKMRTKLNIVADEVGNYKGLSANISGKGFAGMHFIARASTDEEFNWWVKSAQNSSKILDTQNYEQLALPSENDPISLYTLKDQDLFEQILMKYMMPMNTAPENSHKIKPEKAQET